MNPDTSSTDDHPLAHEDIVLFVELDEEGDRTLVGCGDGNFRAPDDIFDRATDLLSLMVPLGDLALGSKVGIVRVLGRGPDKQVTIHCEVEESVTRETYEYDETTISNTLDTFADD